MRRNARITIAKCCLKRICDENARITMTLSINCVSPSSVFLFFFFVSHVAAAVVVDGRSLLMAEARHTASHALETPFCQTPKETLRKLHFQQTCKNTPTVIPQVNLTRLAGWRNFMVGKCRPDGPTDLSTYVASAYPTGWLGGTGYCLYCECFRMYAPIPTVMYIFYISCGCTTAKRWIQKNT